MAVLLGLVSWALLSAVPVARPWASEEMARAGAEPDRGTAGAQEESAAGSGAKPVTNPGDAATAVVVIRGATVLTVTQGVVEGGTVIIRAGKIAAVGKDLPVAEGAEIIEGRRKFLAPGFIDVDARLGLPPRAAAGGPMGGPASGADRLSAAGRAPSSAISPQC
jgi:hypothetical protein